MNPRFRELPEEKQLAILNAAMEVFAKYDYPKASTDLIAAKARVSKGLLFYYFHNKKELYFAVYHYALETVTQAVVDEKLWKITDFYELLHDSAMKKMAVLGRHPYIMDFSIRSYFSEKEEGSEGLKQVNAQGVDDIFETYFSGVDHTKFKADVDPRRVYNMLIWMMDGYLHAWRMQGTPLDVEKMQHEFLQWITILKKSTYREEYV